MILPDLWSGFFDCSIFGSLKTSPLRISQDYEIDYFLSDAQLTFHNDNAYLIKQHDLHITKPGERRYSQLPFTTFFMKFPAEGTLRDAMDRLPQHFPACHWEEIENLFSTLITENEALDCNKLHLYEVFLKLLNLIIQDASIFQMQHNDTLHHVSKAKTFIENHYQENITLKDIAQAVNLSPSYFHALFSSTCSITPHEYLIHQRIAKAKEMLWYNDQSISLIAEFCGFGCQQYMNQVFKKYLNTTPARYRKDNAQKYLL